MKALSLWQPWASLWAAPEAKIHETRSWPTKHRGLLAVHASKRPPESLVADLRAAIEARIVLGDRPLPLGAIVAVIHLVDCADTALGAASVRDRLFGNWEPGRFAWRRGPIVHVLPQPVPCRGFQGLWNLTAGIEAQVREQMGARAAA